MRYNKFVNFLVFCNNSRNMKTLSKKAEMELTRAAKNLGISEEKVLEEAVLSYRARIDSSDLRSELIAWDAASAVDFAAFEKKI